MRYFFEITSDSQIYEDQGGQDFPHIEDAISHAVRIASELLEGGAWRRVWNGFSVLVIDKNGNEVARIPIAERVLN